MSDIGLRRRRRLRAIALLPLGSLLVLVIGWSALWLVARHQALAALDGWLAAESGHGRQWTCPDRTVGGFPLRITLSCREPTFAGRIDRTPATGHVAGFEAEVWLYEPSSVDVAVEGPLALTSQNGRFDLTLRWSDLHVTLRGLVGGMKRIAVEVEQPDLALADGQGGSAEHAELHVGPAPGRPADDVADSIDLLVAGAALPALDAVAGEAAPLDGEVKGVITRAFDDLPDLGPATAERWRRSGGALELSRVMVTKGDLSAVASGSIGLDEEHRPTGRLKASLSGFAPLAQRLGIPLEAVQIGGLLSRLMNRTPAVAPAEADGTGTVTVPVVLENGELSIGPVRTAVRLRPLY